MIGDHFPSRALKSLLPNVLLLENMPRAKDFHIRLAGFAMLCYYGVELTGRRLSEFYSGAQLARSCSMFNEVLRTGRPRVTLSRLNNGHRDVLHREVVSLPILASDRKTKLVLVASFWNDRRWMN